MYRLIIACIFGIILGLCLPNGYSVDSAFTIILPILLFSVGLSLGKYDIIGLVKKNKMLSLVPVFSIIGSSLASLLFAVVTGANYKEMLLNGAAMGFYSLPAIMVTNQISTLAGTMLLITNMIREAITILLAPMISKFFGKYSIIAVGGATTMDVSLSMIKEVAGAEYVPIAILNGLVLTIGVPFIISLILYLNF
jgi:uncharacterized membrane protein YbjE (DUF340 family)